MRRALGVLWFCCASCTSEPPAPSLPAGADGIPLAGVSGGVLLDDLVIVTSTRRVLAAPGGSGRVHRVDVDTSTVVAFEGFGRGAASVDEAGGLAFVADRSAATIDVVDLAMGKVVARTPLGGRPDYVRHSPTTNEVWVTEPAEQRIEVLRFASEGAPDLVSTTFIPVGDGPEGLVFDAKHKLAFIHHYQPTVGVIDVTEKKLVADWKTACTSSHGIPIVDEARGLLFAGCREVAKVTVLSIDRNGEQLGTFELGGGVSALAYAPSSHHFFLRGDPGAPIAILDVPDTGTPVLLGKLTAPESGHVMTADDRGFVWVADPASGRLLRFADPYKR